MGDAWQRFTREVAAKDETDARHTLLSDLGSKHRIPRKLVRMKTVAAIRPDEVTDDVVRHRLGGAK